jgi:type I restriction enzyme, S subunit
MIGELHFRSIGDLVRDGSIIAIQDGNHGGSHPKASEYVRQGIPFVMASDIRDGRLDLANCKRLAEDRTDRLRIGFAKPGDVLLTHKGTVGEVAIVPSDVTPYLMLTPQVTYYRTDREKLDPIYLALAFRGPQFQSQLEQISAQSTRPYVAISTQRHLVLPWVTIVEQRRIASVLGAYDDLIEVNRRRVALLEDMARGLFEEWFVRFRFPGHEAVPIVDTPYGPLPEGWRWASFGEMAMEVRDGVSPADVPPSTPYVGLEHLPRRSTTMTEFGQAGDVGSLKLRFQRGDVLFGKIRPYFHKVAWAPIDGVASSDAIVYRPRTSDDVAMALAVASSDAFVAAAVQTSNGTKMPRANPSVLRAFKVATDGGEWASRFRAMTLPMIELSAALSASNDRLAASRDLLLPRLISGQLSVAAAERELAKAA